MILKKGIFNHRRRT